MCKKNLQDAWLWPEMVFTSKLLVYYREKVRSFFAREHGHTTIQHGHKLQKLINEFFTCYNNVYFYVPKNIPFFLIKVTVIHIPILTLIDDAGLNHQPLASC